MADGLNDIEDFDTPIDHLKKSDISPTIKIKGSLVSNLKTLKSETPPVTNLPYGIPGTQNIFVKTWGCSHNNSDSEYMAGLLDSYGYHVDSSEDEADLWLLNSCTVKGPSQEAFLNYVRKAKEKGKLLVLAGCIPQAQKDIKELEGISAVGVQQIDRIVEVVEETLQGHSVRLFSHSKKSFFDETSGLVRTRKYGGARLDMPKIRKNPLIEIISINTGCLNACTYCKTKQARGDLASYDLKEITQRIEQVTSEEGIKEIWLTSEDLGAYGLDIGTDIAKLLMAITEILPGDVMLRLGMTNPPYILNHLEAIARVLNQPNVYAFLHIPVQCASNKVLEDMKRDYTVEEFNLVVDYMTANVPGILIATDIICGFPTESEEDFEMTLKLCLKYKFPKLHISQFYPRPRTPAMRMKKLATQIVKSRSKRLTKVFDSYGAFNEVEGEKMKVLVTEVNQRVNGSDQWEGRNKFYEKIVIEKLESDPQMMGRFVEVEVISSHKFHKEARFVRFVTVDKKPLPIINGFKKPLQLTGSDSETVPRKSIKNPNQTNSTFLKSDNISLKNCKWSLLILATIVICIFMRYYQL